jgi:hypothetical protein
MCRALRCAGSVRQAISAAATLPRSRSQKITVNQSLSVSTRKASASVRGLGLMCKASIRALGVTEDRAIHTIALSWRSLENCAVMIWREFDQCREF